MTRRNRRFLLYCAIVIFVLAAPAVLLYAAGYSFDWQNKKPVLTGGIYLKSIPKKAEVYLNGKFRDETPAFIKRLVPREYQIKIVKEGFYPWQKKLKVESQLVTEARNILLIPTDPKVEIIQQDLPDDFSLAQFLPHKEQKEIFYLQKPSYILYKTDSANSFQEQISLTPLPADQEYGIFVSSNQRVAVLNKKTGQLYLLNPETKNFELIAEEVQGVQFADDSQKMLYFTLHELWVYYLEDVVLPPLKKADQKELITRLSKKINQAIWYGKTNQHIIFSVNGKIKITELDDRDQRNTVDIIDLQPQAIGYHKEDKKLYCLRERQLIQITLP